MRRGRKRLRGHYPRPRRGASARRAKRAAGPRLQAGRSFTRMLVTVSFSDCVFPTPEMRCSRLCWRGVARAGSELVGQANADVVAPLQGFSTSVRAENCFEML
jgi:hypothetical protein